MEEVLKDISKNMINRYSTRFNELGRGVKTLGWGNVEQQLYRFEQTLKMGADFSGKRILDIGCGFGDYYDYLKTDEVQMPIEHYYGYDINSDLIQSAQQKNKGDDKCSFHVNNILEGQEKKPIADIAIMLGVLNLNLKNQFDNYTYSKKIITNAFTLAKECLIVDFLSTQFNLTYPREDFVFYHNPIKMLEFAFSLSQNVVLKHDYASIPQKEFMLIIYK